MLCDRYEVEEGVLESCIEFCQLFMIIENIKALAEAAHLG